MKTKIVLPLILIIFLFLALFQPANAQWTQTNGVSGGWVWCITSSGSNLYIGTYGYGAYKSTDNGTTWVPINNGLNTVISNFIFSLTVAGSNIVAGTYGGIYYSSNNGTSWNLADNTLTANKYVYALSTLGTAGYVFAGTSYYNATDPKTMFVSTNYGVNWAATSTNPAFGGTNTTVYSLKEFAGNIYAGTNHSVYRSLNFGSTWTQMTGGTMGTDKLVLCLTTLGTTKILAGTQGNGVFWSVDNGASWNPQNTGLPAGSTVYNMATIGSNIFLPSYGVSMHMATDGASLSWTTTASTGLFNKYVYSIYSNGSSLYAGTFGAGVFISINNASTWTRSNNGIKDVTVASLSNNGSTLFAGTLGNGVFASTDNGSNWIQADNTGLTNPFVNCLMPYSTNMFAGTNAGIFLTGNNGFSWTYSGTGLPANTQINCLTTVSSNMFAGGNDHNVYKSTNNGASWTSLGAPGTGPVNAFTVIGVNIFLGCIGNGVYYSLNGGTTWIPSVTGLTNLNVHSLTSLGTTNIYAGTEAGVFFSNNTGATWTAVSNTTNGMPPITVYSLVNDGTNVIAGTYRGIYLTTNNGTTWFRKNQGLGGDTASQCLLVSGSNVYTGMYPMLPWGGQTSPLVWKRSVSEIISVRNISSEVPESFSLMQNYPNPFNPTTMIKWSMKEAAFVTLKVYDVMGREVGTYVNEKLNIGTYETTFDGSDLSSGVYYYKLQAGNFTDTKKMMLIK